tara:strand:- start:105 stop:314 length:210 start_codon:yes stop_codon:yes gene_type:complete
MKYAKMKDRNKFKSTGQKNAVKRVKANRKTSQPKVKKSKKKEQDEDAWYGSEDYDEEEDESLTYYYTDE